MGAETKFNTHFKRRVQNQIMAFHEPLAHYIEYTAAHKINQTIQSSEELYSIK